MSDYERGYKAAVIDTVKKCIVSNEAERAVIEAARKWKSGVDGGRDLFAQQIWDAVEALERAEREAKQ